MEDVTLRSELKPGDIGAIVRFHGLIYAQEYGFDHTFEAYVAGPLAKFALTASSRQRIWIAERAGQLAGCVAIVEQSPRTAQLRWFLVEPTYRGGGLGRHLLNEAVTFCRTQRYGSVILWTVDALLAAAHLYRSVGFVKVEEKRGRQWGADVVEERYEMAL